MRLLVCCTVALCLAVILATCHAAVAAQTPDWPQFHGPNRDACSCETGLLSQWPAEGPKLLWKLEGLGRGYSSVSIAGGRIFTMGDRQQDGEKVQLLLAFDLADRKPLWSTPVGPSHRDGPRCTPTVDGNAVYAIGTDGDLACVEAASGRVLWKKNFQRDFDGRMMSVWKFSESPLVDGDRLVCTPGGPDAAIVALDKKTGATLWAAKIPPLGTRGKDGAAYSSMVAADIEGVRQYIQILGRGAVGVEAATGKFLWGYNRVANPTANITSPVVRGNYVFVTSSYRCGSALLKIVRKGAEFAAEEVYWLDEKTFTNHHGGVVLADGRLYGGDGQNDGKPTCLDFLSGKVLYKGEAPGKKSAAYLYADGRLYVRYQDGLMALAEASPAGFQLKGTFQQPVNGVPAWPHPVICDKKLYLRDGDTLLCYDLAAQ